MAFCSLVTNKVHKELKVEIKCTPVVGIVAISLLYGQKQLIEGV